MNWTEIILLIIVGFTIYRVAKYLETRLDSLEEKIGENDTLCNEWMGHIELRGMLWHSKVACEILGLKSFRKEDDWNEENEKKLNEIWDRVGNEKSSITLHYMPAIDAWSMETQDKTRLLSRRVTGYRNNQPLYKVDMHQRSDRDQLAIMIYERRKNGLGDPRLAFCLMHYRGLTLENEKDQTFVLAEYPLPTQYWDEMKAKGKAGYDDHRETLGWGKKDGDTDVYQDDFGEDELDKSPANYSQQGITVTPLIGDMG